MTISEYSDVFHGKKVETYDGGQPDIATKVYRLTLEYDDERRIGDLIEEFLSKVDKSKLDALIIGQWNNPAEESSEETLGVLVAHAAELPALKALFIGDMTYEDCEISWIIQSDYNMLLENFQSLETLRIRGGNQLELEPFSHPALKQLIIESGGLPSSVANALAESSLPALEHLELWLGTDGYGFDGDVALYERVLGSLRTPGLRYLGLRDSDIADDLAVWLAGQSWIEQLDTLDLSLGTLGDTGAEALFNSPHVRKLRCLDLSHHYISQAVQDKLRSLPISVKLDDAQDEDEGYKYVAVGE
ncbi:STM4015 family protein [Viridibacterium curvum]|uniref:STM4015 family protein n=1 Tax=Viridibacterium curvum TaxID=1101404 RepID=A0ABP9QSS7_9RHOO